jgi:hypothetical protein
MHLVVDILAGLVLLFFILSGWHRGFILSVLGIVRVVLSYSLAYVSGRYFGPWLGEIANRPKFVTIPVCAIMAFALVTFVFHIVMHEIRDRHEEKVKKENHQRPILSCLSGSIINLGAGALTLILLLWLADLFLVGMTGRPIPGSADAYATRYTRTAVFETVRYMVFKGENAQQATALAQVISEPAKGLGHLENVLAAESVQQLFTDQQLADDLMSGEAERIEQNGTFQQFFNDLATRDELQEMGLLTGYETEKGVSETLARFGQNERIQASIQSLKTKQLLSTDKIPLLIRDPDFDTIVSELVK